VAAAACANCIAWDAPVGKPSSTKAHTQGTPTWQSQLMVDAHSHARLQVVPPHRGVTDDADAVGVNARRLNGLAGGPSGGLQHGRGNRKCGKELLTVSQACGANPCLKGKGQYCRCTGQKHRGWATEAFAVRMHACMHACKQAGSQLNCKAVMPRCLRVMQNFAVLTLH
jgi:hypothetical protein